MIELCADTTWKKEDVLSDVEWRVLRILRR